RAAGHLSDGQRPSGRAVDQHRRVRAIVSVPEDEGRVRHVGDRDVRVRAAKDHGGAYPTSGLVVVARPSPGKLSATRSGGMSTMIGARTPALRAAVLRTGQGPGQMSAAV